MGFAKTLIKTLIDHKSECMLLVFYKQPSFGWNIWKVSFLPSFILSCYTSGVLCKTKCKRRIALLLQFEFMLL